MAGGARDSLGGGRDSRETTPRAAGRIASSLQAEVAITASGEKLKLLQSLGDDLRFVLITSRAEVTAVGSDAEWAIRTLPSQHPKCERCWHWRADVGSDP